MAQQLQSELTPMAEWAKTGSRESLAALVQGWCARVQACAPVSLQHGMSMKATILSLKFPDAESKQMLEVVEKKVGMLNLKENTVKAGMALLLAMASKNARAMPSYSEIYDQVQVFKRSFEQLKEAQLDEAPRSTRRACCDTRMILKNSQEKSTRRPTRRTALCPRTSERISGSRTFPCAAQASC